MGGSSEGGILYVAASCRPYHVTGYTTRTQELLQALHAAGLPVFAMTRPGYPRDRLDRCLDAEANETAVEDVCYRHHPQPTKRQPVLFYTLAGAGVVSREALSLGVGAVVAASNHVNALPALLAARRLGLPFFYEMRGLWELSKAAREPAFANSARYRFGLELEALVARHADHVFVISDELGRFITLNFGVPQERISLLPNCAGPGLRPAASLDPHRPATIGYAGALLEYEGLDTLLEAAARLRQRGTPCQIVIAGDGELRPELESLASRLQLGDNVRFLGRLPPEEARQVIARCTLICIPRKPYEVCRLVPPIKLVEAMGMGKAVVVPDLPVFRDEAGDAALFFEAGSAESLAKTLHSALSQPAALAEIGTKARARVEMERTWSRHVPTIAAHLRANTTPPRHA